MKGLDRDTNPSNLPEPKYTMLPNIGIVVGDFIIGDSGQPVFVESKEGKFQVQFDKKRRSVETK